MKLDLELTRSPEELKALFQSLQDPRDIAALLEVEHRDLVFWIYRTKEKDRYTSFKIAKRNGTPRVIDAPTTNVKILQRKLNTVLQAVYRTKPSVHGFVAGKSVKTNAQQHTKKRWVFNIDLEDFFHTIHFGRVRGMFMANPYNLPDNVATVLAHLSCFQGHLPQGAPTSPIISNMICAKMDDQLQRLAQSCRSRYSRYADDITFSTTTRRFPEDLASTNLLGQVQAGRHLKEIIERNGFRINTDKVRLRAGHHRQEVTGVTVNDKPNVPKRFINQIRAMLYIWKKHGLSAAQQTWEEKNTHKYRGPGKDVPRFEQVVKGTIEYLGMIKGQDSQTYLRFLDQLGEMDPKLTGGGGTPLRLLLQIHMRLSDDDNVNHHARGLQFEELINGLFAASDVEVEKKFYRNSGAEQIDGAFQLDGWHYLVECKWTTAMTSGAELDRLSGNLRRSGYQTMGLFISVNGWSQHVVPTLKQDPNKNIMLMNGEDVRAVLESRISLISLLRNKRRGLDFRSAPYVRFDESC